MIKEVREFMLSCPYLEELAPINIDYLGDEATQYTVDSVPTDPIIKSYADGGTLRQFVFVFGSRNYYGPDVAQGIENSGVFSKISKWFEKKTEDRDLPILGSNQESIKIETLTSGYMFGSTGDTARYQIQARLIYYEE